MRDETAAMIVPRLLDRQAAASYLGGVSVDTVDRLIHSGQISSLRLPVERQRRGAKGVPGINRRILVDRAELDELILKWRERTEDNR